MVRTRNTSTEGPRSPRLRSTCQFRVCPAANIPGRPRVFSCPLYLGVFPRSNVAEVPTSHDHRVFLMRAFVIDGRQCPDGGAARLAGPDRNDGAVPWTSR